MLKHRNTSKNKPIELLCFLICFVIAAAVIVPIMLRNHGCFTLSNDFAAEEIPFGMLMNKAIKNGELWNWGIDLGGNLLESFTFYNIGSPFFLITLIFPYTYYPYLIGWIFILKFAVAGATAALWMKQFLSKHSSIVIGSVIYAFSGAACINTVFYHFQDVIALFPLMLYSLDILILQRKRGCFAVACTVNLLCNPVFFFGSAVFTVIYFLIRYLIPGWRNPYYYKVIFVCLWEAVLSCLLSGIILFPTIRSMLSNERAMAVIYPEQWISLGSLDYLGRMMAFLLPAESMNNYSVVFWCEWGSWNVYLPLFGMVFAVAYIRFEKDWLASFIKLCIIVAFVPVLNSVFLAFSPDKYGRWLYMAALIFSLATALVCEDIEKYRNRIKSSCVFIVLLLVTYIIIVKCFPWNAETKLPIFREKKFYLGFGLACASAIVVSAITFISKEKREIRLVIASVLCSVVLFGVSIIDYSGYRLDNSNINFRDFPDGYSKAVVTYLTEIPSELSSGVYPYRYYFDEGIGYTYYNLSMTEMLPSINSFISTCHNSVFEFYNSLGMPRGNMTSAVPKETMNLLGVKYIVSQNPDLPYPVYNQFRNKNGQVLYLYENEDALPIGSIFVKGYTSRAEYSQLSSDFYPGVMKRLLVIKEADEEKIHALIPYVPVGQIIENDAFTTAPEITDISFFKGKNEFSVNQSCNENGFAIFTIPYDSMWNCTVNGVPVKIFNSNGMMAIPLKGGDNSISFQYSYSPIYAAVISSVLGVVFTILYCKFDFKVVERRISASKD